jgi:DNA-binding LacI/PurR family transcriptional regulator
MLWPRPMRADEIWKQVRQNLLNGIILTEVARHDPRVEMLKARGFPFIMMGRCAENSRLYYVDVDFHATLRQCIEHMAKFGHRHNTFINGSQELIRQDVNWVLSAKEGFQTAVAGLGMKAHSCRATPGHAYELVRSLIKQNPDLTGLIILTDSIAPGVLKAIKDAGLRVPQEISLVTNFMPLWALPAPTERWRAPARYAGPHLPARPAVDHCRRTGLDD